MWYKEVPDEVRVSEDGNVEIWWDRSIETTQKMDHNHPDITVDFAVSWARNVVTKEDEKIIKVLLSRSLATEIESCIEC